MSSPPPLLPPTQSDLPGSLDAGQIEVLRDGVRLMALRHLGDTDLAEEVAQETLARTVVALRSARDGAIQSLGAFVHGVARHVIADVTRGRQRQAGPDALAATPDPATVDRDALSLAISAEERAQVRDALRRLSPGDRMILHLSFYEGLAPAEVAQRLQLDPVVVRKRKSRALDRLRDVFLAVTSGHAALPATTLIEVDRAEPVSGSEVSA